MDIDSIPSRVFDIRTQGGLRLFSCNSPEDARKRATEESHGKTVNIVRNPVADEEPKLVAQFHRGKPLFDNLTEASDGKFG